MEKDIPEDSLIYLAIDNQDLDLLRRELINYKDITRSLILEYAAGKHDNVELIEILLEREFGGYATNIAINTAIKAHNYKVMEVILKQQGKRDLKIFSAHLETASIIGDVSCISILMNYIDIQSNDNSAISLAAYNGHTNLVKFLLPLSNTNDSNYYIEPIRMAIGGGCLDVIDLLFDISDKKAMEDYIKLFAKQVGTDSAKGADYFTEKMKAYKTKKLLEKEIESSSKKARVKRII